MSARLSFADPQGFLMQGCQWQVPSPKAIIVLVTGMMETAERYEAFASYLNSLGCCVYCPDHYGQGANCQSPQQLGVWPIGGFQRSIDTLHKLVCEVRAKGLPLYLFAHSMGSYLTQGYVQQYGQSLDRVVLCGSSGRRSVYPAAAKAQRFARQNPSPRQLSRQIDGQADVWQLLPAH